MGVVYRARHKGLDRQVALKVMQTEAGPKRFQHEAQLLARVRSPHVVAVHDFEILPSGASVIVMEWIEGSNLHRLMHSGRRVSEQQALTWMRQTCEGMRVVADNGIVHRDLKPSNLLIDSQGCARVADFGLAHGLSAVSDLTRTDVVMGTPFYMSPEQAEDPGGIDTRADIYSFGATFYHVLTGRPPFDGQTAFSILYKHKSEPLTSPLAVRADLSERTCGILERCLAKSPADRFSSFEELMRHLQPIATSPSPWTMSDDVELAAYLLSYLPYRPAYLDADRASGEELDLYAFPRGQAIRIYAGDITGQVVDAIVSSDTSALAMPRGVALAIRRAGGRRIADEAARQAPIRPGRAIVTSAGDLPARFVFHAATSGFVANQFVPPSRDLIADIMTSCFYHADTHGLRSIAFPLLGTGGMGYPRDVCIDTMFQFLARMFLRGLTTVQDARIVIFPTEGP
jgi:O-acetyl-ADP-ribose deacetylase (regulator of RNase III)/tRNA A-37 threonylcarbamoyl transferase component Bud32